MIDMGFEPDVQKILSNMPVTNQKPDTDVSSQIYLPIFYLFIYLSICVSIYLSIYA